MYLFFSGIQLCSIMIGAGYHGMSCRKHNYGIYIDSWVGNINIIERNS